MAKGYMNNISYRYEITYKGHYFSKSSNNIIDILCYKYITNLKIKVIDKNKDFLGYTKQHYITSEKERERTKQHYKDNKQRYKLYRDNNKEKANKYKQDYNKKKWHCDYCNCDLLKNHKWRHLKTSKHINNTK